MTAQSLSAPVPKAAQNIEQPVNSKPENNPAETEQNSIPGDDQTEPEQDLPIANFEW